MPLLLALSLAANLGMVALIGLFLAWYRAAAQPKDSSAGYSCLYELESEIEMQESGMYASIWNVSCEENISQSPFTAESQDLYIYNKKQIVKSQNHLPDGQLVVRSGVPLSVDWKNHILYIHLRKGYAETIRSIAGIEIEFVYR